MKLSQMRKPEPVVLVPNLTPLPHEEVDVEIDDTPEENFEVSLVAAVDYLRRANNILAFVYDNAEQHDLFGEKSRETLSTLIDEVAEFLGEYE
jgi:hypothetical protein